MPSLLQMYFGRTEFHPHGLVHGISVAELLEIGTQRSRKSHFEVFMTRTLGV